MKTNLKMNLSWLSIGMVALAGALASAVSAHAAHAANSDDTLDQQLQSLNLPSNQAPAQVSTEKLYSVQSRYVPVDGRSEFSLGGGKNFTADSFINSSQINLAYRYHLNDKWSFTAGGSYVFNSLSDAGQRLLALQQLLPDVDYVKYRLNALASYNVFYGKFRVSMDQVFYFDQYIAAGPGLVAMDTGTSPAAVGDIGFIFWVGRQFNAQIGVKDYYYNQKRVLSSANVNDAVGHIDFGILLGGERL
jgi:outer membrane beta-barrel protein